MRVSLVFYVSPHSARPVESLHKSAFWPADSCRSQYEAPHRCWAELAYGRAIFDRFGRYAATPEAIAAMLEDAVKQMQARAAIFAGRHREHTPTIEHPFIVVLVDEVAFLTAYLSDRALRDRIKAALATLTLRAGRSATRLWPRCRTRARRS
jgi:hypothetical protein